MGSNSSKIPTNPYAAISKGFNRECFLEHNRLRAIHNSPNLRLDKKLMNSAQKHAEAMARENQLRMQEDIEYGQNAAMQVFSNYLTISGTEVARLWYKHSANYDYNENNQYDKSDTSSDGWNLLAHDRTVRTTKTRRRRRKCHKLNKTEHTDRRPTNTNIYSFNTNN
ncbi:hypothetical protein PHET_03260 [Paragonimus heterotremus]|uniref:SCP domain-containing protein n=1 Tax=Paragonimus heterotremus TaxID=100268 RepID=A0A8J4SRP2_9TREM|nr:hypothetical protein PHET_03260 [Paragonimus heterotremus]